MCEVVTTNESLIVTYEIIELHSQLSYKRRSFIDKFKVTSNGKEDIVENSNLIEGSLTIDAKSSRLLFKPNYNEFSDLEFYRDNFCDKYAIDFSLIKQIVFLTHKNEYYLKSKDLPHKSFRSFCIYCYNFRVYNFNRRHKHLRNETIKFYQTLAKVIYDSRRNIDRLIDWTNVDESELHFIYKENVCNDTNIRVNSTKQTVTFVPEILCDTKKFKYKVQFAPQIGLQTTNDSFLIISDKPDSRSTIEMCHRISKSIVGKEVSTHSIFYLNCDGNKAENTFPTNRELVESYEKLYSLCTPRNKDEFKHIDKKWQSKLADSGWLTLVNKCLSGVSQIVTSLNQPKSFVFLMESACPLWSWLFVSLVQICLQPYSRTMIGFNSLIKKNWLLVNNAFNNSDSAECTLFLLFLDCVYQFLRCSPYSFEFNEEMLICLYDIRIMSQNDSQITSAACGLLDIDWNRFYVPEVVECFLNHGFDHNDSTTQHKSIPIPEIVCYEFECFWSKMYTRWIPYMQIESGCMSLRHYAMVFQLQLENSVHSNYPFSLNYDKITTYNEDSCHDDMRSVCTVDIEDD